MALPNADGHADSVVTIDPGESNLGLGFVGADQQTPGNAASRQRELEQRASGFAADGLPNQLAAPLPVAQ